MNTKTKSERLIKRGKRIYGAIYKLADGREVYMAWRKNAEIFRAGDKSLSGAIARDVAAWAIDDETLIRLRVEGVSLVGVMVKDTGDLYIAALADFLDSTKSKIMNYETRGGALQRYLPLRFFGFKTGAAIIK